MTMTGGISASVDLAEIDALIARMERVEGVVAKYADLIYAAARRFAPVKTGYLRSQIAVELEGLAATISSNAPYAAEQEYGTARQAGTAHIRPAVEQYRAAFLAEVAAIFGG
jgi:HK97 gp10 family phage protein